MENPRQTENFQRECRNQGRNNIMEMEELIVTLVVGGVAGWLAGLVIRGGGLGLIGNIIVGVLGAFIGGFLFEKLGISVGSGIAAALLSATVGAAVLLLVIGLVKKK